MSRLRKRYKAMKTFRKEGHSANDALEQKANELREETIKKNTFDCNRDNCTDFKAIVARISVCRELYRV